MNIQNENLKFSDLKLIFKDLKNLFEKRGFIINWKGLEKQSLDETINALAMASPFTLEEKQALLDVKNLVVDLSVEATKEFGGVITSSPFLTPSKCNASVNASVPLFKDTQYLVLQIFDICHIF